MPAELTTKTLRLDPDDERDINAAIAYHQSVVIPGDPPFRLPLPDGDSCTAGAILGEICRDWLESHGALEGSDA